MSGWAAHEYTRAAGTLMHSAVLGRRRAPSVVCVHGLGCSHRYFLPFAKRLAGVARVAAVDLPGFGRTAGPPAALDVRGLSRALADWLRATDRGGSVLVANSGGCQVVADLAVHAPELLGPVVLVGPTMDRSARSLAHQSGRLLRDALAERPWLAGVLAWDYSVCGPRRFLATFRHLLADPIEHKLRRIQMPAVVVRGGQDTIVPRAWAQEVADALPDGWLAEVPGAPHAVNYAAPEELARITRPLLALIESGLTGATAREDITDVNFDHPSEGELDALATRLTAAVTHLGA